MNILNNEPDQRKERKFFKGRLFKFLFGALIVGTSLMLVELVFAYFLDLL